MARPAATGVNPHSPAIDQKEKLIAATERLLCSQGLGCVTTRDIARAAKVAEGALYHHFGDKAELILSVVLHQLGDFPDVLQGLPLQIGQNTVQKNLERVLESAFAFHHRIAPLVCSLFADQELLARVRGMMHVRSSSASARKKRVSTRGKRNDGACYAAKLCDRRDDRFSRGLRGGARLSGAGSARRRRLYRKAAA